LKPLAPMPIVDTHVHIWPDPRPERPYPWTPDPHPIEVLVPLLESAGVSTAVQVTPTIMGFDNQYGVDVAERLGSLAGVFGRFDPDAPGMRRRLEAWSATPGALGIRLTFFQDAAGTAAELRRLDPLWADLEELDVPVAVLAPAANGGLAQLVERHPKLRLVVDHLGLGTYDEDRDPFADWHRLAELAEFEHVLVKISTLVEASAEDYPFRDVHERLAEVVELFGARRLMWGSNHPVVAKKCGYAESLNYLGECAFLSREDLEWLTHRTFTTCLGRNGGA